MTYDREFQVYTDQHQCDYFDVPYFERDVSMVIAASTLLESKDDDQGHKEDLSQVGSRTIKLHRTSDQMPGWWRVTEVY